MFVTSVYKSTFLTNEQPTGVKSNTQSPNPCFFHYLNNDFIMILLIIMYLQWILSSLLLKTRFAGNDVIKFISRTSIISGNFYLAHEHMKEML